MGRIVTSRIVGLALSGCALVSVACSDLAERPPAPDGGADAAIDTDIVEPPDPPGPSPWTRRSPEASPPARIGHALAYDPARAKVVLFGGISTKAQRDLWEWDGATGSWTDRTPTAFPAAWPSARVGHTLVWDNARQRVVLFGGDTTYGVWLQDVWEWDGGTWVSRTPAPIPTTNWPDRRFGHGMAADDARGRLVMYGGGFQQVDIGDGAAFGDTWEWDGATGTWVERTPTPRPALWPTARKGLRMTWDGHRQRVVMFMGYSNRDTVKYDPAVWEWDGTTGAWSRASVDPPPMPWPQGREDHALVWDAGRDRLVLFAGWQPPLPGESITAEPTRDLWELEASTGVWTERTLPLGTVAWPLARMFHAMVFDTGRQRVMLFGGGVSGGRLRDTWEWNGSFP